MSGVPWTLQSKRSDHLFSPRGPIIRLGPDPEVAWAESFSEVIVEGAQDPISEGREETKIDVASTRLLAVVQTVKLSARVPSAEGTRIHAGLEAFIVSADALTFEGGQLRTAGTVIDLVYNRLTNFYFEAASHNALLEAYETGAVVVTPDPHAHAMYADKRNLNTLSDREGLVELGVLAMPLPSCRFAPFAHVPPLPRGYRLPWRDSALRARRGSRARAPSR